MIHELFAHLKVCRVLRSSFNQSVSLLQFGVTKCSMDTQRLTSPQRKRVSTADKHLPSSITDNTNDRLTSNQSFDTSQTPCLVTEMVTQQLRPVFKEAADALQKYIADHSCDN